MPSTSLDLYNICFEKGRKWAIDCKGKYFTGERYTDTLARMRAMDVMYDWRGRASERGGRIDNVFMKKTKIELTKVEFEYQGR